MDDSAGYSTGVIEITHREMTARALINTTNTRRTHLRMRSRPASSGISASAARPPVQYARYARPTAPALHTTRDECGPSEAELSPGVRPDISRLGDRDIDSRRPVRRAATELVVRDRDVLHDVLAVVPVHAEEREVATVEPVPVDRHGARGARPEIWRDKAVSYTHLTLPTIY